MILLSLARVLLPLQVLLTTAVLALWAYRSVSRWTKRSPQPAQELRLHYALLSTVAVLSFSLPWWPEPEFFQPIAKSMVSVSNARGTKPSAPVMAVVKSSSPQLPLVWNSRRLSMVFAILSLLIFALHIWRFGRDSWTLKNLRQSSYRLRQVGRVQVYVSDEISIPLSYWTMTHSLVLIPLRQLERPQNFRMILAHELQHHRQRDTHWLYLVVGLKAFAAANPLLALWSQWISDLQEFACDEALLAQNKVESLAYARCLVEVAESALTPPVNSVRATGFLGLHGRKTLLRRIENMLHRRSSEFKPWPVKWLAASVMLLLSVTAFASHNLIRDRHISMLQAEAWAERLSKDSNFPIVLNQSVLTQLNRYVGTAETRARMRRALQRMEHFHATTAEVASKYGLPSELLSVPLVESWYENRTQAESSTPGQTAGLWQFVPSTAEAFGLHVDKDPEKRIDGHTDERLDVQLSTDAAARYLLSNHLRFQDWQLAVMAYNMGERQLQKGIEATGSRDAWFLIHHGYEGDKNYLAKVMAAILIAKNPEILD